MSETSSHKPLPPLRTGSSATHKVPAGSSAAAGPLVDGQQTVISSRPPVVNPDLPGSPPLDSVGLWEGEQLGQFVLEKFIGGGGMGIVFRALDTTLNREVAVKVLSRHQSADDEALRRFRNEAQSAARLNHDNIARVFYVGEDRGVHYIVFEFIAGVNIRDLVEQHGPLPLSESLSYTHQIAQALEHASQRAVIHRDIKPSNVLISADGKAKLVDMGLARLHQLAANDDLTASGVTLGTFDYISPEQARDPRSADVRSDLYSLGCSFYFMLTGRPPFPDGTVLQKLLQHQGDSPPDPRNFRPELPPDVTRILAGMLAKDPAERYQSPAELIDDLTSLGAALGIPLSGTRPAFVAPRRSHRLARWQHHLPWAVPLAALLLIVLGLDAYWSNDASEPPRAAHFAPRAPAARQVEPPEPTVAPPGVAPPRGGPGPPPAQPPEPAADSAGAAPRVSPEERQAASASPTPQERFLRGILDLRDFSNRLSQQVDNVPQTPPSSAVERSPDDLDLSLDEGPLELAAAAPAAASELGQRVLTVGSTAGPLNYSSLQAACRAAKDGDVIELCHDGSIAERPFEISNMRLTIRARAGCRPVVAFRPESESLPVPAMVSVVGGELAVRDVHWELELPRNVPVEWALIETRRSDRLYFQNCTMTVRGNSAYHARATFFDVHAPPGQPSMGIASDAMGDHVVLIELDDCIARGDATLLRDNDLQSVRLTWNNGLLATSERLFVAGGSSLQPARERRADISLTHVTAMVGSGLVLLTNSVDAPYQLSTLVTCNDSIVASAGEGPMIEQRGSDRIEQYQTRFQWVGNRAFFSGFDVFWQIMNPAGQSGSLRFDFSLWSDHWAGQGQQQFAGPAAVSWRQLPAADRPFAGHVPADYGLDTRAVINEARRGASDSRDAGCLVEDLPLLPLAEAGGSRSGVQP